MTDGRTPQQQEPSMEEILASIRKIISEDGDGQAKAAGERAEDQGDDDVLELTEMVDEPSPPPRVPKPPVAPDPAEEDDEVELQEIDTPAAEPEPAAPPPPTFEPARARPAPPRPVLRDEAEAPARVLSDRAADASSTAFAELARALDRGPGLSASPMPLGESGRTLEDMVRELLKPMLRDWLDANLPDLVQRLVRKEIKEMVRRAEDR